MTPKEDTPDEQQIDYWGIFIILVTVALVIGFAIFGC